MVARGLLFERCMVPGHEEVTDLSFVEMRPGSFPVGAFVEKQAGVSLIGPPCLRLDRLAGLRCVSTSLPRLAKVHGRRCLLPGKSPFRDGGVYIEKEQHTSMEWSRTQRKRRECPFRGRQGATDEPTRESVAPCFIPCSNVAGANRGPFLEQHASKEAERTVGEYCMGWLDGSCVATESTIAALKNSRTRR